MTSPYLKRVADELGIPDSEVALLDKAGVRNAHQLHSVLAAFPSISPGVLRGTSDWKPHLVLQAFSLQLSTEFRQFVSGSRPPPSLPYGATPPPLNVPSDPWPVGVTKGQKVNLGNERATTCWFDGWSAQDQGTLGTCVSYAPVACCEWQLHEGGTALPGLSERMLYWGIKSNEPPPLQQSEGDWLYNSLAPLAARGLCARQLFPFEGNPGLPWPPGSAPPAAVLNSASNKKFVKLRYYNCPGPGSAALLRRCLDDGPAAINLPIYQDKQFGNGAVSNWTTNDGIMYGFVANPVEEVMSNPANGGHIVCVVGFVPDQDEPMGGHFIVKNSWGTRWSIDWDSPETNGALPDVGYGSITATYVEGWLRELLQFQPA
jgi:hypothetical protein